MPRLPSKQAQVLREQIMMLYINGDVRPTLQNIAQKVASSRQYVSRVLKDAGIKVQAGPSLPSKQIRLLQKQSGLSIPDFATLIGIPESRISHWFTGAAQPKGRHALRLYLLRRALEHVSNTKHSKKNKSR
jgi:DNA-binding transcriptional regulator YiaG